MLLTPNQLDRFHRDGFILIEGLFDPGAMTAALNDMEKIFYGKSYVEYLTELDKTGKASSVEPTVANTVAHYGDTE